MRDDLLADVKTLGELLAEPDRRSDWGPWQLDADTPALYIPRTPEPGDDLYWLPLDSCVTSAAVLDWIFQVNAKTWATVEIRAGLLNALDDVLDPQSTICSFGQGSALPVDEIRARAADVATWLPAEVSR